MTRKILLFLNILLITQICFSQTFDKAKLDNYLQALEDNNKFMGSVSIAREGKVIYTKSIGFADVEQKIKLTENSKFRIGSISKTFTAALVFKAIEERKIKLTDVLAKYYPSIKNSGKITISSLLYHRSGLHNFTDDEDYLKWNTSPKTENEMIAIIAKAGSDFEPDTKAEYSNSNFVILSYILEKIYKKKFKEILTKKIIIPLGLKNTFYGGKIDLKNDECNSYTFEGSWTKESETNMSVPMGAGAVVSTPNDLTKFIDELFQGKVVSNSSLEQMKTIKDHFGMGLFQIPFYGKKGFGHTGGIDGFSSMLSYFPEDKLAFALTSNGNNYKNNDIAIAALSCYYNKPFSIPDFKTFAVSGEDLDQYLGTYSSKEMPLKITITKKDRTLIAQATGQSPFPLDAKEKDKFEFAQAGVVLEFKPEEKQMILKQGGGKFTFSKDENK